MQGHFRESKNNRLISKKSFNLMETKEKNQYKKVLIVIQFFRINLLLQPVLYKVTLFCLQSTIAASGT